MGEYVFGAVGIIAYLIWTYDACIDMYWSHKFESSIHSSTALWLVSTFLGIIILCLIYRT